MDQPFTEDGLYALRSTVAAHATEFGADAEVVEVLLIVASELAINAIRHAGGRGRLRLWRDDGALHLEVTDRGPGINDPTVGTRPPDQLSTSGRGLWICRQLVRDLAVITGPTGTTITAVLGLAGDRRIAGSS